MPRYKYIDDLMTPRTKSCAHDGCLEPGEHKAPLSRSRPNEYQYLCMEHIREFNKKWDYFSNMSQPEIEAFQKEAVTGHRPTWRMSNGEVPSSGSLREALRRFVGDGFLGASPGQPPLKPKDKMALADLDLTHPVSRDGVKTQYKKLVKRYHPDRNPDNKQAEERFKQITASYHYLIQYYCPSI